MFLRLGEANPENATIPPKSPTIINSHRNPTHSPIGFILGSLEYACKVSGAKVIIVLGHENCGAIKSAVEDVQLGNITALLAKIKPAVVKASENYTGEKTSKNKKFLEVVTKTNIELTVDNIRQKSPILREMEEKDLIKIAGAEYHMENGNVEFLNDK
ncbi:carbonate dehydratase [Chryseobacterium indoltheticum]|nr:carbonate dehydratase [Chryseobacterium indoltheticum]